MTKKIKILFNTHKIRYSDLESYFKVYIDDKSIQRKQAHIFIDFNFIIQKYMYILGYFEKNIKKNDEEDALIFVSELLNLVTHYKSFFYKHFGATTYVYITINNITFGKNQKIVSKVLDILKPIIDMIPEVNIITYANEHELCYLKYHLIYKITKISNRDKRFNIFFDIGKTKHERLYYMITKNIYFMRFDSYTPYLEGFDVFRNDILKNVENVYVNSVLAFIPLMEALNVIQISDKVKVDDIILKYIKNNISKDFNDNKVRLLVLKMFTENRKVERIFKKIEHSIKSLKYKQLVDNLSQTWRNKIFDKNIYRINEIFKIDKEHQIQIEKLLSC